MKVRKHPPQRVWNLSTERKEVEFPLRHKRRNLRTKVPLFYGAQLAR